jgi:hypothetical protein
MLFLSEWWMMIVFGVGECVNEWDRCKGDRRERRVCYVAMLDLISVSCWRPLRLLREVDVLRQPWITVE